MTRVLLIADSEKVQRIFQSLEEKGVLQLQTASTLELGESEMAASRYDYTFVQGRISGFSGEILLRHLDKILPEGAQLVLLGGDPEDAAQARKHGRQSLDLSMGDDLLKQTVLAAVTGAPLPELEKGEAPQAAKASPAKTKNIAPPPAEALEPEQSEEPPAVEPPADLPEPEAAESEAAESEAAEPEAEEPPAPAPQAPEDAGVSTFEEAMQRAAATVTPIKESELEVEGRVELGKGASTPEESPDETGGAAGTGRVEEPVPVGAFIAAETLAEAMRRAEKKKSRRAYLIIVPVLLLIAVPLGSYLVGRNSGADSKVASTPAKPTKPPAAPIPAPPQAKQPAAPPVAQPAAPPVAQPAAPPVAQPAAPPVAQPAAPPVAQPQPKPPEAPAAAKPVTKPEAPPAAKPEVKQATRGRETLPPMLEGTRLDPDYGKSHPGWTRYIGLRAEYKLFKENNLYKAMQVVGGGGTISNDLFKRVLREFSGMDRCLIESSSKKGDYLVEQCSANGNTAVTVYRDQKTLKMKAFVVYYR